MTPLDLADATDEDLLMELFRRNLQQEGPDRMAFAERPLVTTIGIGKDHVATIVIHQDDMDALYARLMVTNEEAPAGDSGGVTPAGGGPTEDD